MQVYIYSCCGSSNVGQLSNSGASKLAAASKILHCSISKLSSGNEKAPEQSEETIISVIDGCEKQCVNKIFATLGIQIKNHLILTDLGLEKTDAADFTEEELKLVMDAIQANSSPVIEDNMEYAMGKPKCPCFS